MKVCKRRRLSGSYHAKVLQPPTVLVNLFGSVIRHVVHSAQPWCAIRPRDQQYNALFGLRNFVRIRRSGRASSRYISTEVRMNSPRPHPKGDRVDRTQHNTVRTSTKIIRRLTCSRSGKRFTTWETLGKQQIDQEMDLARLGYGVDWRCIHAHMRIKKFTSIHKVS